MSDFKTKLGLRKLNLNIIGSICTNIAAKRGKIKILSSDAEDYETKKAAEAQIKYIGGELTELKRAYELFGKSEHLPKYSNVEEEAADVIICTLVLLDNVCHTEDIGRLITDKMKFNDQRED